MIRPFTTQFLEPAKKLRRLSVLTAIHENSKISQHKIGRVSHLSSSMVNNYIKELQQEGLITVDGNSNRTHRYHLTPSGRDELVSLLIAYSTEIIQLYGAAKRELSKILYHLYHEGIQKVALFGAAETAEVVFAAIQKTPLTVTSIFDSDQIKQGKLFNGLVIQSPEALKQFNGDAVVITSFARQEEIYKSIKEIVGNLIRVKKLSALEVYG